MGLSDLLQSWSNKYGHAITILFYRVVIWQPCCKWDSHIKLACYELSIDCFKLAYNLEQPLQKQFVNDLLKEYCRLSQKYYLRMLLVQNLQASGQLSSM